MKLIFFLFGLISILIMVLLAGYYVDAFGEFIHLTIDNTVIKDFVDKYITIVKYIIKFLNNINRMYVFIGIVIVLLINIITFIKVLDNSKKDYLAPLIRIFFSPITAILGICITFKKNKKKKDQYSYDTNVNVSNDMNTNDGTTDNIVTRKVYLKTPNKPILLCTIETIIGLSIFLAIAGIAIYGVNYGMTKFSFNEFPFAKFFIGFFGIIFIIFLVSLPSSIRYGYRKAYLERIYKAIKEGTSYEDALPLFKEFEKYASTTSGNGRMLVEITIKSGRFKNSDYETKQFLYKNGIMVEKDQGYRRTYMSHQ